jgi:CheY-like chemotaxis protein
VRRCATGCSPFCYHHLTQGRSDLDHLESTVTHKVLIVDDSKLARMAVAKTLAALHPEWVQVEAANADEAVARIKEGAPDFVLLDFNMPGKDGLVLAAELRQSSPGIRVAVLSANRQTEVITRTHSAGATFLAKPLSEKALADFLNNGVAQRRPDSQ